MSTEIKLTPQKVWQGVHRDIPFKIVLWNEGADYTPGNEGIWNCYIYLPEKRATDFAKLWLPDQVKRFSPESPERISHNYYGAGFPNIEMHGGVTYYAKHGHTDGHRVVEVGCDYSHLWDHERGGGYTPEWVAHDAEKCIDQLFADGILL